MIYVVTQIEEVLVNNLIPGPISERESLTSAKIMEKVMLTQDPAVTGGIPFVCLWFERGECPYHEGARLDIAVVRPAVMWEDGGDEQQAEG